jgi:integrase
MIAAAGSWVSPLILATKTDQSFKKRYFSECWDRAMSEAGLETITLPDFPEPVRLHFHDLRGTTITLLSEAGRNEQQIATITGHSLKTVHQILERYLPTRRDLLNRQLKTLRTLREQNLQTSCKLRNKSERKRH